MNRSGDVGTQELRIRPVGVVHTKASQDEVRERKEGIPSEIEVFPQFAEALDGIEGFSHIFIIGYLNQLKSEQIGRLKLRLRPARP